MGKIKPTGFAAHFDVKPLIPNTPDKFSRPPKKKKFRLKLRFSSSPSNKLPDYKVKVEKKSVPKPHSPPPTPSDSFGNFAKSNTKPIYVRNTANDSLFWTKPIIPGYYDYPVKQETDFYIKQEYEPQYAQHARPHQSTLPSPYIFEDPSHDPTYTPNSSDDDSAYVEVNQYSPEVVLRIKPVNTRKLKVKKEKKIKKSKKPRRRYKRRVLSDSEKLQASRRRRTCLVKKPKSDFLGVSWCNTKNTWVARVWHPTERKLIWAGYHQDERACALAVNEKCLELKIPLKNPHITSMTD